MADQPDYESAIIYGLRTTVQQGDRVTIIGGGIGVTSVIAAQLSHRRVECFEASSEQLSMARSTIDRNRANVAIHHGVVGKAVDIYPGDIGGHISICDLPECDVLELDCEGSEAEIIREMHINPRGIVVETHGIYGSSTSLVASLLERRGYHVDDLGWAEPRLLDFCRKNDIRALTGTIGNPYRSLRSLP
jgi:hypothetical protein